MLRLASLEDAAHAIRAMQVRGAPLIGATAAYGVALGLADDASDARLQHVIETLAATRPTAVNLHWALARMNRLLQESAPATRRAQAWQEARAIAEEDKAANAAIGRHGLRLIAAIHADLQVKCYPPPPFRRGAPANPPGKPPPTPGPLSGKGVMISARLRLEP
ncbi:MAG: hypothetical protein IPK39_02060 [Sulfuritalea sp.]|nr:hypothetical protein [Sulfuritalea sp.]